MYWCYVFRFFFSSRRRHTRFSRDWSSDVCSSDLAIPLRIPDLDGTRADGIQDDVIVRVHTDAGITGLGEADASPEVVKALVDARSEERRVGKECRCRRAPEDYKKKRGSAQLAQAY